GHAAEVRDQQAAEVSPVRQRWRQGRRNLGRSQMQNRVPAAGAKCVTESARRGLRERLALLGPLLEIDFAAWRKRELNTLLLSRGTDKTSPSELALDEMSWR